MKISLLQENLNKGLGIVSRFIATKATLPILSNILLSTDQDQLKLSATNLEMGINFWLGAKIEKEGAIAVPARLLAELISSLPPEKIDLETKENTLFLSSGFFKAEILGMPQGEFPQIPSQQKEQILTFDKNEIFSGLSQVCFAAAQDESRPVLTGILLRQEEDLILLVATDGYRLSLKKIKTKRKKIGEESFIIPAKTLIEISRIIQEIKEEEEISINKSVNENQVIFSLPGIEIVSRLIEGNFPEFEKIIPQAKETRIILDKDDFFKAVKIASIFAREKANIVKIKTDRERISVSAESPQVGVNETQVEGKIEGQNLEIAFNFRFLLDFLNASSGKEVVFEANGPLSPGVFRSTDDDSFLHIIMPVRIQS